MDPSTRLLHPRSSSASARAPRVRGPRVWAASPEYFAPCFSCEQEPGRAVSRLARIQTGIMAYHAQAYPYQQVRPHIAPHDEER